MNDHLLPLFFLGTGASIAGNMIGFGGGIFVIPILVIVFKVPMPMAVGSITFCVLLASSISTLFNFKNRSIDIKVAVAMEIPTILGALIGAKLTSLLPIKILELLFALFVAFIGYKMLKPASINTDKQSLTTRLNQRSPLIKSSRENVISVWVACIFGGIAGIAAGLFGIGGGFLKTPVMIRIVKLPVQVAVSTSLFMIVFTSFTSSVSHFLLGHVEWSFTLPLAMGFGIGALAAQKLKKISDKTLEKFVGVGLFVASLSVLVDALIIKT